MAFANASNFLATTTFSRHLFGCRKAPTRVAIASTDCVARVSSAPVSRKATRKHALFDTDCIRAPRARPRMATARRACVGAGFRRPILAAPTQSIARWRALTPPRADRGAPARAVLADVKPAGEFADRDRRAPPPDVKRIRRDSGVLAGGFAPNAFGDRPPCRRCEGERQVRIDPAARVLEPL